MTQEFDGDFIEDVFDDYLQVTTVRIKPPGTAAAVLAVRKRRRKRAFIVAAVAALVLALPVAAYVTIMTLS